MNEWLTEHKLFEQIYFYLQREKCNIIHHFDKTQNLDFLGYCCCLITKSCPTLSPHELQHARLPCPSGSSRACSNSYPSSQWCHSTISSFVIPFSSHLQFFPASVSFSVTQFFTSGGQSIGASASASVLPMNVQDWFPLGWLIQFPCCPRDFQESSPTPQFKSINSSALSFLNSQTPTYIHDYWKNHSFHWLYGLLTVKYYLCFLICCQGLS